jgi:uncharacterized protein (TIGR02118 family)
MVKVLTFLKRKPGMAVEEFQQYWLQRHPAVVTRLPGVRRYVQSHTLASAYRKGEPPWTASPRYGRRTPTPCGP